MRIYIAANSFYSSQAELQGMALACSQAICQAASRACLEEQQAEHARQSSKQSNKPGVELAPRPHAGANSAALLAPKARGTQLALMRGVLVFTNMNMSGLVN